MDIISQQKYLAQIMAFNPPIENLFISNGTLNLCSWPPFDSYTQPKSILQAILNFPSQIDTLEILNPSLEKDFLTEKGAVLDLAIKLHDGR